MTNLGLLLCIEPSKKFWVGGGGCVMDTTPNVVFCFGPKLWFWPRPKLNNKFDLQNISFFQGFLA